MSYYMRGDYYYPRGDYYRGDPGFWSVLKGIGSTIAGFIPGLGPIASKAIDAIPIGGGSATGAAATAAALTPPGFFKGATSRVSTIATRVGTMARAHPVLTAIGAAGAGAAAATGSRAALHALAAGKRKRRRMRVTNPRALRRAIRRTTGFAKLAMRTIHLVHPKKKCSFGGFRRKRKR